MRLLPMSLRGKVLVAAAVSVLLPLAAYLLFDTLVLRKRLERDQAESLRLAATVVDGAAGGCASGCNERLQAAIDRLSESRPEVEVIVVDRASTVLAATRAELIGASWEEDAIWRVLRGGSAFEWATMNHAGRPVLDVTVPLHDEGGTVAGAVHVARTLEAIDEQIRTTRLRHAVFVVAASVAAGLLSSLLVYLLAVRRLAALDREMHERYGGRSGVPRADQPGDEIDHISTGLRCVIESLAQTASQLQASAVEKDALLARIGQFNQELEREVRRVRTELLDAQQALVRVEHLSTIAQLAAGLAHELRNPLFIIRATAEAHERKCQSASDATRDIIEEVDRVDAILTRLLDLGRPLYLSSRPVDLGPLLVDVADKVRRTRTDAGKLAVTVEVEKDCRAAGDEAFLHQAFANLATNACDAVAGRPGGGKVRLAATCRPDGRVEVVVEDDGDGIAAEDLPQLFRPFFTRKAGGIGLGLCATKKVLDLHGATVAVDSAPGRGTRFVIALPGPGKDEPREVGG